MSRFFGRDDLFPGTGGVFSGRKKKGYSTVVSPSSSRYLQKSNIQSVPDLTKDFEGLHLFESLQRIVPVLMMHSKLDSASYLYKSGTRKQSPFQVEEQREHCEQVQRPAWQYRYMWIP